MQKIIYTNARNQSIQIGCVAPYILSNYSYETDLNHLTTKASSDGKVLQNSLIEKAVIEIEGAIIANDRVSMYEKRKQLLSVLNPKAGEGELIYINESGELKINAILEEIPNIKERHANNMVFRISFVVFSDPFWKDVHMSKDKLTYLMGGMRFPLVLPTRFATRTYKKEIVNGGDIPSPVLIEFYGPATNPTIKNNTRNEFIRINKPLLKTEKLIINTEDGNKKVEIEDKDGNRTNAFNYIDLSSVFWKLVVGVNEIEYNSNNDSQDSKVVIKYNNRYVGC